MSFVLGGWSEGSSMSFPGGGDNGKLKANQCGMVEPGTKTHLSISASGWLTSHWIA